MGVISIVVDDVDGDDTTSNSCHESSGSVGGSSHPSHQLVFFVNSSQPADGGESDVFVDDNNADARSDVSHGSKSSRGSTSREESESRLQQIKVIIHTKGLCAPPCIVMKSDFSSRSV